MTKTITRWCLWLLFCLVVSGCSSMPAKHRPAAQDAEILAAKETELLVTEEPELFAQGLDEFLSSGELTSLRMLSKNYPKGVWLQRAEGVIAMAERQQQLNARLEKTAQQLTNCEKEKDFLVKDNKILETTLERLKQVLIDMELRVE